MADEPTDVHPVPESPCPVCGYRLNAAGTLTAAPERRPQPDDLSICLRCGAVLVLIEGLRVRLMTNAEWLALDRDTRIQITQAQTRAKRIPW